MRYHHKIKGIVTSAAWNSCIRCICFSYTIEFRFCFIRKITFADVVGSMPCINLGIFACFLNWVCVILLSSWWSVSWFFWLLACVGPQGCVKHTCTQRLFSHGQRFLMCHILLKSSVSRDWALWTLREQFSLKVSLELAAPLFQRHLTPPHWDLFNENLSNEAVHL